MKHISFIKKYEALQRTHEGEIPRLGGLVSYLGLVVYYLSSNFEQHNIFFGILISSIPFLIPSIAEDLSVNVKPIIRLIFMFSSSLVFLIFFTENFPIINFPIFGKLISDSYLISLLFFSLCLVSLMNGANILDGSNGLAASNFLAQTFALLFLCYHFKLLDLYPILISMSACLLIFLLFNYPYGRIFLGDSGAYLFSFILGSLAIYIFSQNPHSITWGALLIFFYNAFEVTFSFIRKIFVGKSPLIPDYEHLHLKAFYFLKFKGFNNIKSNSLVMFILIPVWLLPFIFFLISHDSLTRILISLSLQIIIYLILYYLLPSPSKKNL